MLFCALHIFSNSVDGFLRPNPKKVTMIPEKKKASNNEQTNNFERIIVLQCLLCEYNLFSCLTKTAQIYTFFLIKNNLSGIVGTFFVQLFFTLFFHHKTKIFLNVRHTLHYSLSTLLTFHCTKHVTLFALHCANCTLHYPHYTIHRTM